MARPINCILVTGCVVLLKHGTPDLHNDAYACSHRSCWQHVHTFSPADVPVYHVGTQLDRWTPLDTVTNSCIYHTSHPWITTYDTGLLSIAL